MKQVALFWFRRDLRLSDNAGLYHALKSGYEVVPVFIFDTEILRHLNDKADARVSFIHDTIVAMQQQLHYMGSTLHVLHTDPLSAFRKLTEQYSVVKVYTNHDYEPYATGRDARVAAFLQQQGIPFQSFKDQVIFEKDEVVKDDGRPYTVFTPFSKKWLATLNDFYLSSYPTGKYHKHFYRQQQLPIPSLSDMGFTYTKVAIPATLDHKLAKQYDKTRDFPGIRGTTHLGLHLRFGTVSIRQLAAEVKPLNATLLNELIWRDFYHTILWHFPHVVNKAFKPEYDYIQWRNNETEFQAWCQGQTGYPIVDAGMRELNETGYMHNRVRMITASFLTKHLLIDWRWGEAYFAAKLLDYDLAANNGGWQWAAGSGCDAAPYFRVFNPYLQTEKFDPDGKYIRKWVPELESLKYPRPIVEHAAARERCLKVYKEALQHRK